MSLQLITDALEKRRFNTFGGDEAEILKAAANVISEDGWVLKGHAMRLYNDRIKIALNELMISSKQFGVALAEKPGETASERNDLDRAHLKIMTLLKDAGVINL